MAERFVALAMGVVALLTLSSSAAAQTWNFTGMTPAQFKSLPPGGPAPVRDLSGIWDGGPTGVGATGQEGFLTTDPFKAAITARLTGASEDALSVPDVDAAAGKIYSAYAIGGKTGAPANPLRVLLCEDSADPAPGSLLTSCAVAP